MNPKKNAVAGSLESSDVMITVAPAETLTVGITSVVFAQWGRQIEAVVRQVLDDNQVTGAAVSIHDKGARECTLRARLKTALARSGAL